MRHNKFIVLKREIIHHLAAVRGVEYVSGGVVYFNVKVVFFIYFRKGVYNCRGVAEVKTADGIKLLSEGVFFLRAEKAVQERDV